MPHSREYSLRLYGEKFFLIMNKTFDTSVSPPRLCALLIKGMFMTQIYLCFQCLAQYLAYIILPNKSLLN